MFGLRKYQTFAVMACFLFATLAWSSYGAPTPNEMGETELAITDESGMNLEKKELADDVKQKMGEADEGIEGRMLVNQAVNAPATTTAKGGAAPAAPAGGDAAGGAFAINAQPSLLIAMLLVAIAKLTYSFAEY